MMYGLETVALTETQKAKLEVWYDFHWEWSERDKTNLDAVTEDMQGVGVTEKGWGEMKAHDLLWWPLKEPAQKRWFQK